MSYFLVAFVFLLPSLSQAADFTKVSDIITFLATGLGAWIIRAVLAVVFVSHLFSRIIMKFYEGGEGIGGEAIKSVVLLMVIINYTTIVTAIASAVGSN